MSTSNKTGKKIREYREFRQVSRDDLAFKTGLTLKQLETIEEKGIMPSLGHLIKISRALGVRLGTFLDDQEHLGPVITKAGTEKATSRFSTRDEKTLEHLNFFSLAQDKTGRHMEPFIVDIEPAVDSDYKLSSHEGEEFIFVQKGQVEINYGKETFLLNEGDSIYLDSVVAHNVHAAGNQPARILAVIYYPL